MALRCTVCDHTQRQAIDSLASLGTEAERSIAKQFNLSPAAVHRHIANGHIPAKLTKALARAEAREADEFLDSVRSAMAKGAQGAANGLARAGEIDAETAYRSVPAFLAQQLRAAELLGNATGRLNAPAAAGATNVYLSVVLPRGVEAAAVRQVEAIDVQALPAPDPDPPTE